MFVDFDTMSLKVHVLRDTETCAGRRCYDRRHVTLVAYARANGSFVRPALLWLSGPTSGDLFQHDACPISMKGMKARWSLEDIVLDWVKEFASLTAPTSNPYTAVVPIVDGSKTHLLRAIIDEAVKLGMHLVPFPSH